MWTTSVVRTARVAPATAAGRAESRRSHRSWMLTVLVATAVLGVAYADGGYGLRARSIVAITIWWALIVGFALGLLPRRPPPRPARVVGWLLAAFAAWTLASTIWAPSAENAFIAFDRVGLYLGVFAVAAAAGSRATVGRWLDGIAIGVAATAAVALLSQFFPHLFPGRGLTDYLIFAASRLSFPLGYWNGLGIFVGLGAPLVLRIAAGAPGPLARAAAFATVPCLAAAVYLTASRGGVGTAVVGTLVLLAAAPRRWPVAAAIVAGGAASAVCVAALVAFPRTGSGGAATAASWSGLAVVVGCGVLSAAAGAAGERLLRERTPPRRFGRALVAAVSVVAVAGVAFSHPLRRWDDFTKPLPAVAAVTGSSDFAQAHLLSGSGSGRWQFWGAAVDEFESSPLYGGGAGSYAAWWAQHAPFAYFLRNAHSLYLETLGELGIVGALLLVGAFGVGAGTAVSRVRSASGADRVDVAGALSGFVAFCFGASLDWVWQLPVVTICGVALLGLLVGSATSPPVDELAGVRPSRTQRRLVLGAAGLVAAWALVVAQAIPWLVSEKLAQSRDAAQRGDIAAAVRAADDARAIQPWAASPYVQLALLAEDERDLPRARHLIGEAVARDARDWQLWYVRSRLAAEAGDRDAARRDLARARDLNPRSPILAASAPG